MKETPVIIPKVFTRDFPLVLCQIWGRRYKEFFGTKVEIFPRNIYIFQNGLLDAFRNQILNSKVNDILLEKIKSNPNYIKDQVGIGEGQINELLKLIKEVKFTKKDFLIFLNLLLDCWQRLFISLYVPPDERFSEKDREHSMNLRLKTEKFEYEAFKNIDVVLSKLYPELGKLARYISLDEIENDNLPVKETLQIRSSGRLIVVDDKIVSEEKFSDLQKEFRFSLEEDMGIKGVREFKGQSACPGVVVGEVQIILRNEDVKKMVEGRILVSSMTVPTFLSAMKKAAAFVTDEGGITCHAAIVAREMKKPCIIGTKIATKSLNDGDLVQVDGDSGIVKILK